MNILTFCAITIVLHTIADWFIQTRWQAENKSTSYKALAAHILTYYAFGGFGWLFILVAAGMSALAPQVVTWWFINSLAHAVTDWVTSRVGKRVYAKEQTKQHIWKVIGTDQAIHLLTFLYTASWML